MTDSYRHHAEGPAGGPLVFAFHGTGGDERQLVPLAREAMPGARIVAPRGDVSERGALRFFRRTGEGVYDMADLARASEKMAAFVASEVAASRPSRVGGIGYSNGANILAAVIFARPALFDDAVLMHPLIPWTPEPVALATRILVTAGERDPICPPQDTRALAAWLAAQGAAVETVWHPGGHELARAEVDAAARHLRRAPAAEGAGR